MDAPDQTNWRRAAAKRFALAAAIIVVGVIFALLSSDTQRIVGWAIAGVGVVLATSLAFLEVGYAEDRERARARRR